MAFGVSGHCAVQAKSGWAAVLGRIHKNYLEIFRKTRLKIILRENLRSGGLALVTQQRRYAYCVNIRWVYGVSHWHQQPLLSHTTDSSTPVYNGDLLAHRFVLLLFIKKIFLVISVRPLILISVLPIFTKFVGLVDLWP